MQNIENNSDTNKLTMDYVLEQIEKISQQTDYLFDAIEKSGQMPVENGPGDIAGRAKAEVLGTIVKCRETTNQQLLSFCEKLYDDLKESIPEKSIMMSRFEEMTEFLKSLSKDDFSEEAWRIIDDSVMSQLGSKIIM